MAGFRRRIARPSPATGARIRFDARSRGREGDPPTKRRSTMRWTTTTMVRQIPLVGFGPMRLGLAMSLLLAACSSPPSKVDDAPKRPPDDSYETGGGLAWRVLVWKCDERNERTSIIQSCSEGLTGCGPWRLDRTLCPVDPAGRDATRTASEGAVEARGSARHPIPDGYGWR
jgi:hypothetical protein